MNMKILSPAGDMESLKMAVFNGADEVYLGIKDFNARNIEGFNLETLKQALDFAHAFNVKVFLTVNILFRNDEMQSAIDLIVDAYNLGVDAFIIQDIGLAYNLQKHYPQIEKHASTQMGIHNLEGAKFVEKLGFKRVVLSRETPLEEIRSIKENTNLEIEYFGLGALCVSFSGNCYLSSYICDASGNRGKCKQLCRLPYSLFNENKKLANGFLLSAKDLDFRKNLKDLHNAGVTSLKIEGRARRPYYVAIATREMKNAINGINEQNDDLLLGFNRGFSNGYLDGNENIISQHNNHIGIEIGIVEKVNIGKRFNEIYISSSYPVTKKSTLKFFEKGKEIATLSAFDIKKTKTGFMFTSTSLVSKNSKVNLISDFEKEEQILNTTKKQDLEIKIIAKINQPIKATLSINQKELTITGDVLEKSETRPLTKDDLINCFSKNDFYNPIISSDLENVFILKSKLNEFRRNVFECIANEKNPNKQKINKILLKLQKNTEKLSNFQVIFNKNEKLFEKNIIYSPEVYNLQDIKNLKNKCEKENKKLILDLPNFALNEDVIYLKDLVENLQVAILVNNPYALNFNTIKYIGWGMNVYNSYTANYFNLPYVLPENEKNISAPVMTLRHCPMKNILGATCETCPYNNNYTYKMQNGKVLKLKRKKLSTCTFYLYE
ncbi:MAG: U32 family peptidase [Clostridiales bacterium]|nr:U32 family peptidase [Clostridiales bacterium]